MSAFLDQLQQHLREKHLDNFQNLTLVFPSRRAALFFKNYILQSSEKVMVLPKIYSIEEFLAQFTQLKSISGIAAAIEFYLAYRAVEGTRAESFDQFLKWGPTMLSDFSELDAYLVPTDKLFNHLKDIRALEAWNIDGSEPSEVQREYVQFWEKMGLYYEQLKQQLLNQKLGYSGLMYRFLSENQETLFEQNQHQILEKDGKVVFAGFNALNKAEVEWLNFFNDKNLVEVYWDADDYYLSQPEQEAGWFIRQYQSKWPGQCFVSKGFKESKKIKIVETPNELSQANALQQLLPSNEVTESISKGIVLASEELLIPVLNNLPEKEKKINATLGFPLKLSPVFGFVEALISVYWNAVKMKGSTDVFYYKNVEHWLSEPIIHQIDGAQEFVQSILKKVKSENRIFISQKWWNRQVEQASRLSSALKVCFQFNEVTSREMLAKTQYWLVFLEREWQEKPQDTEQQIILEYLQLINGELDQLDQILQHYQLELDIHSMRQLVVQVLSKETIAFTGEPLGGLQVMGMLETRLLDFDQITVLSLNEGILPKGKKGSSFIPFDVRIAFQLPTHKEKDAIFAYYFYRLIQRAKEVNLLYSVDQDGFSKGEMSRFILQLKDELPNYHPDTVIEETKLQIPVPTTVDTQTKIEKDDAVMQSIFKFFERGVSPSSLNLYFNSPLDFYYQYIVQIHDDDKVEEEVEDSRFGSILHDVLEKIYIPYVETPLSAEKIKAKLPEALQMLENEYLEFYSEAYKSGEIWLSYQVSRLFLERFFEEDAKRVAAAQKVGKPIVLLALEKNYTKELEINGRIIKFKGKVDRVEQAGKRVTVIDYKSGIVKANQLRLTNEESLMNGKAGKIVQLLMYQWLCAPTLAPEGEIDAAIVSLGNLAEGVIPVTVDEKKIAESETELILKVIGELVTQLTDEHLPFERPVDYKYPLF